MSKAPPNLELAARLREARARVFKSAAAAADALGYKAGTVRAHENGQNGVGAFDLETYARRYGVTMDWLITGRGDMEPNEQISTVSFNSYCIMGQLRDDVWVTHGPGEDRDRWPGWAPLYTPAGIEEAVDYSDPRFPDDLINAMKVRTDHKEGPYIDGSIVFAVDIEYAGWTAGDHVITIRQRGEFCEWSVRKARFTDTSIILEALISDAGPISWAHGAGEPDDLTVVGIVIGSLTRRPVAPMTIQDRRYYEADEADRRRMGDK